MAELAEATKFTVRSELLEDGHVLRGAASWTCAATFVA
jgi:hypothetical protein